MNWLPGVLIAVLKFFAGLFTTKEPVKNPVSRPKPEVEIDDGKTDEERLNDLGL